MGHRMGIMVSLSDLIFLGMFTKSEILMFPIIALAFTSPLMWVAWLIMFIDPYRFLYHPAQLLCLFGGIITGPFTLVGWLYLLTIPFRNSCEADEND